MRLLIDCSVLSVGGGLQVGLSLINNIAYDKDFEVIIIASNEIDHQIPQAIKDKVLSYTCLPQCSGLKKIKFNKLIQSIESRYNPDLIFTVFGPSYWRSKQKNLQGFALGKMLYPEVRDNYSSKVTMYKEKLTDFLKKYFLKKNSDCFVVETEVVKQRMHQYLSIPLDKIFVVSNSYSPDFEKVIINNNKKVSSDRNKKTIFIPASFYQHKNLLILPYVARELLNLGFSTFTFKFTIPENSTGWSTIMNLSNKLGVDSHFCTLGHVDNTKIGFEYLNSDLILCTSLVESSTAVFPESFIAKRPLAVSDRDFAKKLCEDGVLYFDPLNSADIAQTIVTLINNDDLVTELVDKASIVLKKNYLSPAEKWQKQKELLTFLGCEQ
ncbi:glycosyltransferase [Acinetobacter sp.]|uniref:glycosyltransferase n=1 Tax=Acinetobacter sp. TaxID=472 RepID=UPI003D04A9E9